MGRAPCCDKANVKKGPWSPEEDAKLKEYIDEHGTGGNWIALPQKAGLRRCGKSCRLRWLNYLRPNLKHGEFSDDEERIICTLFANIGSRWSVIAAQLPGRTDNDIKNYWNTKLKKKFMGIVPPSQTNTYQANNFSSSSIKASRNNNTYYSSVRSFTGLEPILMAPNYFHQPQESFVSPIQNNFIMFGGEASCSSSDGSYSNQISNHGRDIEYEYGGGTNGGEIGLKSYSNDGVEENQKFMLSNGGGESWRETSLNFCLEEIKQLISTNGCNNTILFDENKTEERVMYY